VGVKVRHKCGLLPGPGRKNEKLKSERKK